MENQNGLYEGKLLPVRQRKLLHLTRLLIGMSQRHAWYLTRRRVRRMPPLHAGH